MKMNMFQKFKQENFSTPLQRKVFISSFFLYMGSSIGVNISAKTIGYWLLDEQYSYMDIAFLTSILHLPYSMRVIFTPWLDYINIINIRTWGHRKTLIFLLACITFIALLCISFIGISNIYYCLFLCAVSCICSTSMETLISAFYVHTYHIDVKNNWITGGQIGYQFGLYSVYTLLLALSHFISWNVLFFYSSFALFIVMIALCFMDDCKFERQTKPNLDKVYWQPMKNFYQMHKDKFTPLMIFSLFYRAPDKMIAPLLPLLMISIYGKIISAVLKTFSLFGIVIGSFAWKMFKNKHPVSVLLLISRIHMSSIVILGLASLLYYSTYSIYAMILISLIGFGIKVIRTMESAAIFSFQCSLYDNKHFSAQSSIGTLVDKAFGDVLASTSGAIRDVLGWNMFFIFSCVMVLPSWSAAKKMILLDKKA